MAKPEKKKFRKIVALTELVDKKKEKLRNFQSTNLKPFVFLLSGFFLGVVLMKLIYVAIPEYPLIPTCLLFLSGLGAISFGGVDLYGEIQSKNIKEELKILSKLNINRRRLNG